MAIGAAILSGFSAAKGGIKLANKLSGFLGGGSRCKGNHRQAQKEIAANIREYLTPRDRQELVSMAKNVRSTSPEDMALFFIGGKDCYHKNVGSQDQRFLDELPLRIQQRAQEAERRKAQTGGLGSGLPSGGGAGLGNIIPAVPNWLIYVLIGGGVLVGFKKLKVL